MNIIDTIEREQMRKDLPDFGPGDTVRVRPSRRGQSRTYTGVRRRRDRQERKWRYADLHRQEVVGGNRRREGVSPSFAQDRQDRSSSIWRHPPGQAVLSPRSRRQEGQDPRAKTRTGIGMKRAAASFLEFAGLTLILAVLTAFAITFVAMAVVVQGSSMEPALHDGERVLVNKLVYRLQHPRRGEIVVFRHGAGPGRMLIKRVIGLPQEELAISGGLVYVNGAPLAEPYILERSARDHEPACPTAPLCAGR